MLQSITEYYRVLQSIAEYCTVLQSITEYYKVLQCIIKTNLAHLLGPIFGLVLRGKWKIFVTAKVSFNDVPPLSIRQVAYFHMTFLQQRKHSNISRLKIGTVVNHWKFAFMMLQLLLLFLYQTPHLSNISRLKNGTLVNRWKFALMMLQPLLSFLYQTQHKQYLSIENGQSLEVCFNNLPTIAVIFVSDPA